MSTAKRQNIAPQNSLPIEDWHQNRLV